MTRSELIDTGAIRPADPAGLTELRPHRGSVLRLDDAGRAAAAREMKHPYVRAHQQDPELERLLRLVHGRRGP